jgi:HNH endonuclease
MPDGLRTHFAVEHYRPQKKFPHLALAYSNLFWACPNCNVRKGKFWPTRAQRNARQFIANPCDHVMTAHVKYDRDAVTTKSETGRFMVDYLDLNLAEIIILRGFIRSSIRDRLRDRREGQALLAEIEERLKTTTAPGKRAELWRDRKEVEQGVAEAEAHLKLLLSTDNLAP